MSDDQASTLPVNRIADFVAVFHSTSVSNNEESKTFDFGSQALVIIDGGSNIGKLSVQCASFIGIGKIIVVAGTRNADALKTYGAISIIDCHVSNVEIKSQIQHITGDDLLYVVGAISTDQILEASLLPSTECGKVAKLVRGKAGRETWDVKGWISNRSDFRRCSLNRLGA